MPRVSKIPLELRSRVLLELKDLKFVEAGKKVGFDKYCKDDRSILNAVYNSLKEARLNPKKYGVTAEYLDEVGEANRARMPEKLRVGKEVKQQRREKRLATIKKMEVANMPAAVALAKDDLELMDVPALIGRAQHKSLILFNKKLDRIGRSNKNIDELKLTAIAGAAGELFQQSRVISGEATENIAVLAKIQVEHLSPEETLAAVLSMREAVQVDKENETRKNKRK